MRGLQMVFPPERHQQLRFHQPLQLLDPAHWAPCWAFSPHVITIDVLPLVNLMSINRRLALLLSKQMCPPSLLGEHPSSPSRRSRWRPSSCPFQEVSHLVSPSVLSDPQESVQLVFAISKHGMETCPKWPPGGILEAEVASLENTPMFSACVNSIHYSHESVRLHAWCGRR